VTKIRESTKKDRDLNKVDTASPSLSVLHQFLQVLSSREPIQIAGYSIQDINNILSSAKGGPDAMEIGSSFLVKSDIFFPSLLGKKAFRLLSNLKTLDRNDSERYYPLRRWIDLELIAVSHYPTENKDPLKSGLRGATADSSSTGYFKPFINRPFRTASVNEQNLQSPSKGAQIPVKSDVLTLGRNIFFPKNIDIYTPKGFAMLTHEITHVQQYDQDAELRRGNVSEFRRTLLEKDALNNEQTVLNYLSQLTRRNRNMLSMNGVSTLSSSSPPDRTSPFSPFRSNFRGEFNPQIPSIMTSAQTFTLNNLKNISEDDSDNNQNLSPQNFSRDILSVLSAANSRTGSSSGGTLMPYVESPENREVPEMTVGTKSSTYSTTPAMDLAGSALQPPTSAVPLYAEADRPLTSQPAGDGGPMRSIPASTNATPYDLDVIVNKVYELFERKIKKERERKGIR
jgi:hypothetical protein